MRLQPETIDLQQLEIYAGQRCRCDYNKKLEMYLRKKYAETKDMPKCKCDYN